MTDNQHFHEELEHKKRLLDFSRRITRAMDEEVKAMEAILLDVDTRLINERLPQAGSIVLYEDLSFLPAEVEADLSAALSRSPAWKEDSFALGWTRTVSF